MAILYILLLGGLGFASFVLLLLCAVFAKNECCNSKSKKRMPIFIDEEESLGLHPQNNNNPPPRATSTPRLMSPASAPVLTDLNLNQDNYGRRMRRNTSTHSIDPQISPEEMRAVQSSLLRNGPFLDDNPQDSCNLLIGVYANSEVFCGYCVNLQEKWVEYYKIQTEHLPWRLLDQPDDSEFEMRNFFFALMLWNEEIEVARNFHIYTGNRAINHDNNRLWRRAAKLLEHYSACKKIVVGNDCRFHVNPKKDATSFAKKIVPAEDLSMDDFVAFQRFISQYYQIEPSKFTGSHSIPMYEQVGKNQRLYEVTQNYQKYIDKVKNARLKCAEPCEQCAYIDDEAATTSITVNDGVEP